MCVKVEKTQFGIIANLKDKRETNKYCTWNILPLESSLTQAIKEAWGPREIQVLDLW